MLFSPASRLPVPLPYVGIFMSRVPALPNLFAPREPAHSLVLLVIARLGIREGFTVVRTRLPLALVLNYGGPSSAFPSHPLCPLQRLYVPTLSSASRGKARRKWLFRQSYTGLAWKYGPWVHYDRNSRLAICAAMAERIESALLFLRDISSQRYPIRSPTHGMIEYIDSRC